MLAFHQRFPLLLKLWDHVLEHPPDDHFPDWMRPWVNIRSPRVLALLPRTLEDVKRTLLSAAVLTAQALLEGKAEGIESYGALHPGWKGYFEALAVPGQTHATYEAARNALLKKWPAVPRDALLWGRFEGLPRPAVITRPKIYFSETRRQWADALTRLAWDVSVVALLPIYADTTKADVLAQWPTIKAEQQRDRPARRARPDSFETRLQVWDLYTQLCAFTDVARQLHMRPTTVKWLYAQVSQDILGTPDAGKTHQARIRAHDNPTLHVQTCPQCQKATRPEDCCRWFQEYANQDYVAQRELPTDRIR